MALDPITAAVDVIASLRLGDLLVGALHPSAADEINAATKDAQKDMQLFVSAVLAGNGPACDLLIGGLRNLGPLPELTAGDLSALQAVVPSIDGGTLVRLYVLGRQGNLAERVGEILQAHKS